MSTRTPGVKVVSDTVAGFIRVDDNGMIEVRHQWLQKSHRKLMSRLEETGPPPDQSKSYGPLEEIVKLGFVLNGVAAVV